MKISIVTVSYNSELTIGDTLRSVATQSHPDVEHIVVDGASRDSTLEIVHRDGAHVTKVLSEPDQGIYDAMNKGLRLATGDLVGFLNADDMLADRDAVARLAASAGRASADAVFGDLVYVRAADLNAFDVLLHRNVVFVDNAWDVVGHRPVLTRAPLEVR